MKKILLDVHTHTIASGHAYGTITEMAKAAAEKGIELLGITEHTKGVPGTCEDIYFGNLSIMPRNLFGVELLLGAEINILDYEGTLSFPENRMHQLDLRIAGIHGMCYTMGSIEENTNAIVKAIQNPYVDIISHPDDGNCPLDYEKVIDAAQKFHTLLEINNNSLRNTESRKNVYENSLEILKLCKKQSIPVLLSSDAHYMNDLANLEHVERLINEVDFPDQLIINYSVREFKKFILENRKSGY